MGGKLDCFLGLKSDGVFVIACHAGKTSEERLSAVATAIPIKLYIKL